MKIVFSLAIVAAVALSGCSSNKSENKSSSVETAAVETPATSEVEISDVNGYFAVNKVESPKVYVLDEAGFKENFHPAPVMGNPPTSIDFAAQKVAAIVLPETEFETTISIDKVYQEGKTLNIVYSYNQGTEKRTFTTKPVKIFTFSSQTGADTVVFKAGDQVETIALK